MVESDRNRIQAEKEREMKTFVVDFDIVDWYVKY